MNLDDELAIIALCSQLVNEDQFKPLETKEWAVISQKLIESGRTPKDLFEFTSNDLKKTFDFSDEEEKRVRYLLDRSSKLAFEIEKLNRFGINIVTRSSKLYPKKLKSLLGQNCPPLFYYAGKLELVNSKCIGFVGSRDISENDEIIVKKLVNNAVNSGFGVVSGGAKGVDSIATAKCLESGGVAIEFLSDSMIKKLKNSQISANIRNGKLVLLSYVKPDAGFNVGTAMQRNKFIYAQSIATVVIKSKYNEGGTWSGAVENLKQNYTLEFCLNEKKYIGNRELIRMGATPIDENFDFTSVENIKKHQQTSLFD